MQDSNETADTDRRGAQRHRVFKGATLSFNNGYGALECVVRNVSEGGARLAFGETSAVPPAFDMCIKGQDDRRPARVRWRTATAVGVSFG